MKLFTQARKYGAQIVAGGTALALAASAHAAGPIDDLFAAVDLTTVVVGVVAMGVVIIGIAMAFKGIDLSKRGVKKV